MQDAAPDISTTQVEDDLAFDLTWPDVFWIPEELQQPPRMNEKYLRLNRLVGYTVHALELAEVLESRIKLILHISDKGLRARRMPVGVVYGFDARVGNALIKINKMTTAGLPKAQIAFLAS